MPRRSYLHRIAEPVTAGDQVWWPIPLAAGEDARPGAFPGENMPAASSPVGSPRPAGKPTIRPSAVSAPASARRTADPPAVNTRLPGLSPAPDVIVDRREPDTAAPEISSNSTRPDAMPPVDIAATPEIGADPAAAVQFRSAAAESGAAAIGPVEPPGRGSDFAAPATGRRSLAEARRPPPIIRHGDRSGAPRLHIGTIEIRTPPPPQAPTAAPVMPSPAAAPAPPPAPAGAGARAYAWRYGLVQG